MTKIKMPTDDEVLDEMRVEFPKLNELSDNQVDAVKEAVLKSVRLGSEMGYTLGYTDGDKNRVAAENKQFIFNAACITFTTIILTGVVFQFLTQNTLGCVALVVGLNTLLHVVNRKIAGKLSDFVLSRKKEVK
jgi:hypothetical protein